MDKLNCLVAYPYCSPDLMGKMKRFPQDRLRFLLDCGAFTAWQTGKKIELDDYCKFVETCDPKPWRYFSLDVIGDAEKTAANFEKMLERGFKPVPRLGGGGHHQGKQDALEQGSIGHGPD